MRHDPFSCGATANETRPCRLAEEAYRGVTGEDIIIIPLVYSHLRQWDVVERRSRGSLQITLQTVE